MKSLVRFSIRRQESGQSLVEVALFLPILLLMLVGIVEIGNLLVTQNRVTTAARTGAGFGASYYVENDWAGDGGTAAAMGNVVLNTVTETLELDPQLWDVWSIYGKVNAGGNGFETFDAVHVQGTHAVVSASEWNTISGTIQTEMIQQLTAGNSSVAGLEVVASLAYHNLQPMLGVNVWQWTDYKRVRDLTVMRVDKPAPYIGCDIMPISVYYDQISRYPYNYTGGPVAGSVDPAENLFLEPGDFNLPSPGPDYSVPNPGVFANVSNFHSNLPGIPLLNGRRGYLYLARTGSGSGGFGWLSWNDCTSQGCLADSLAYPGNFWQEGQYIGSDQDEGFTITYNGQQYQSGDDDGALEAGNLSSPNPAEQGEWIHVNTGNVNSDDVRDNLEDLFGRTVRFIVYDASSGTGNNQYYHVYGFLLVRIVGWDFTGNPKRMAFEFIRWDATCDTPQIEENP